MPVLQQKTNGFAEMTFLSGVANSARLFSSGDAVFNGVVKGSTYLSTGSFVLHLLVGFWWD